MVVSYPISLEVKEPNNDIGILRIRQSDEESQTLVVQVLEYGLKKSYEGLQIFFCAKLGQTSGLGIIEQKLLPSEMTDPKNGKFEYTMRAEDWQQLGRQTAYFSFRKMKDDHTYVQQFSTRDFTYEVTKNIYSDGIKEVTKDGSTYVWTFEDLLRLLQEFKDSGETDFLEWFAEIKDQLSEDAAGNLMLLYQSLRDKTGKDDDFRGFESNLSYMKRVYNENTERGVNVKWFGAKGDGLNDDTAAIQFALDTFKFAFLPKGNYKVSRIVLPSNSKLIGVSKMDSVIIGGDDTLTTEIVAIPRSSAYTQIEELSIKGNSGKASGIRYTSDGTEITGNNRHRIKNLYISDVYIGVVVPYFLRGVTMDDVMVERSDYNGFNIQCTDSLFNNLISAISKRDGFYISGSNNRVSNIKAYYAGTSKTAGSGVKIETCSFTTFNNIELQENVLDNIQVRDCSSLIIQNLISDGAGCLFGQGMGVDLKYLDGEFGDVPICDIKINNIRNCIIDAIVYNGRTTTAGAKWQARYGLASMAAGLDNGNTIRVNIRNDSTDSTFNRFGFRTNTATLDSYLERNSVYINAKIANSVDIYVK